MSGSAGGNRIPRESLKKTAEYYIDKVLKNFPGFTSAKISGSYNTTSKSDFGDIDLVISITSDKDKKDVKKDLVKHLESLPQDLIVPFKSDKHKNKRTLNHGEIITVLFPIIGLEDQFVQIDNIISLSEEEGEFKKSILDLPAERQGLILGLIKTPLLEEEPEKVFARMGIKDIEPLGPNQEYEFHINTSGLTLRKVTLDDNFKTLESTDVWKSTDFNDVKKLLSNYNLEGSFKDLIGDIKKLKNPRSKNRVKGWFLKNIRVQAGERGTPKADQKQQAIDTVAALEEKYNSLVMSIVKPILLEDVQPTIALMPGAFKPPHRDHLRRINAAAKNADQAIILISPKERAKEGEMPINAEQSIAVWQLYKDKGVLKPNVTFEVVPDFSPVKTAYDIIAANPQNQYIGVYGKGEASRWKNLPNEKYPNATASDFGIVADLSATDLRTALLNGGDITPFLPKGVTPEEYKKALNIESLTENSTTDNIGYRAGRFNPNSPAERLKDKGIGIVNSKVGLLGTGHYFMGSLEDAQKLKKQLGYPVISQINLDSYNLYRPNDPVDFYENLKATTHYLHGLKPKDLDDPQIKENVKDAIRGFAEYLNLDPKKTAAIFKQYLIDIFKRNDGDLLSNRLLSNYDGIDLRGTDFDDFGAGSIIFNGKLKSDTYSELTDLNEGIKDLSGLEEQRLQKRIAYDAETRMQTRFLMKQFLKNIGTEVEDSTEGTLVGDEYELVYGFYPKKRELGFMPFRVDGIAGPEDITIIIKYNPELLTKKLYSELSAEIRNSVRHELEHLAQYRAKKGVKLGGDGVNQDDLSDAEYLTLNYEIPGHIQGLRTKAKAKKISLQQAIDDLFNSYEYDLTPEEEDFVRKTWMDWLKTNMPGVSLTKIKEDLDSLVDKEEFLEEREFELTPREISRVRQLYLNYAKKNLPAAQLDEGVKDLKPKIQAIMAKHQISAKEFSDQLKKGTEVEKEHTSNPKTAMKIALDHIDENPKYYDILATVGLEERITFKPEFTKDEVEFIEDKADNKMQPEIDIDLSSNHFFDRLNDPRNYPDIEPHEIEDFFDKLADKKEEFILFLKKYKQIVTKDGETNINIPFMKAANKAIAKTVMRKKNFKTPNPILSLEEEYTPQKDELQSLILDFTSFLVTDGMKLHPFPKVKFEKSEEEANNPLGKTAYYNPEEQSITLFILNRHPKDILRSYSHELAHHMQNLEGRLKPMTTTNVHEDDELAEIEKEAHELGSLNLRKWEDSLK